MMTTEDILRLHPELSEEEAAEIAAVASKYLKQMVVVKNAQFAFSPKGRKRDSGAMRKLHRSVASLLREEQAR